MAKVSDDDLATLANLIIEAIKEDFATKNLSKNLVNTIVVEKTATGISVVIPAEIYNMYQFFKHGVIIPTGKGSYASSLDTEGSAFMYYPPKGKRRLIEPRNHIGYVDRAIDKALTTWKGMMQNKYNFKSQQEL